MKGTIKIPSLAFQEVGVSEFVQTCKARFLPESPPKFAIMDVVMMKADFGRELPAMVIGVEPREVGWFYHLARPRWIDGVVERVSARETELKPLSDVKKGG
jgi:hypothetical protein